MARLPERTEERVAELIVSIKSGASHSFAQRNAALTLDYLQQLHYLGTIDGAQLAELTEAVETAARDWKATLDKDGWPLEANENLNN